MAAPGDAIMQREQESPDISVHTIHGNLNSGRLFGLVPGHDTLLVRTIGNDPQRIEMALKTGTDRDPESDLWANYPGQAQELERYGITDPSQFTFVSTHSSTAHNWRHQPVLSRTP